MIDFKQLMDVTINKTLLYIEDDEFSRIATIELFEDFFKQIIVAKNGKEGLELYNANKIDVIITDLNMPIMGGDIMVEKIREIDKNIPILIFSAYNEEKILNKLESFDIQGYLFKPMQFEQISNQLIKIFSKSNL